MRRQIVAVAWIALLLPACVVGAHMDSFGPAHRASGADAVVSLWHGADIGGEVLAVEDSTLLVVTKDSTLIRLKYPAIKRVKADYGGFVPPLTALERERLRLASRYPDGVNAELERNLLAAYRKKSVAVIER